ncbi:MAG: SpoVG family protein [Planctomycetaceae bacterium]|nr:SpoVG family protein [Planctomycetaceae bacterium]
MEISEVRIKLMADPNDRLKAFCSITLDSAFVIRDLKIIQGGKGLFVAMPSRKLTDKCPQCSTKNNLRAAFCNECGHRLRSDRAIKDEDGRAKLYADIAHPINSSCRDMIQEDVIKAYEEEIILSRQDGYLCRYDDYGEDTFAMSDEEEWDTDVSPATLPMSMQVDGTPPKSPAAQIESHSNEPLRGPHTAAAHRSGNHEVAGRSYRSDASDADSFGEGII